MPCRWVVSYGDQRSPRVCTFCEGVVLVSQPNGTRPSSSDRTSRLQAACPDSGRGLRPVVYGRLGALLTKLHRPLKRPFPKPVRRSQTRDVRSPLKRAEQKGDERRVPVVNDRPKTRLRRASPVNGASGRRKAIRRSLNVETPGIAIHADVPSHCAARQPEVAAAGEDARATHSN